MTLAIVFTPLFLCAQLDSIHYIPPIGCSYEAHIIQNHSMYISTPSDNDVTVTIKDASGAIVQDNITVNETTPYQYDIGNGVGTTLVPVKAEAGQVLTNKGYIVEATGKIYVNVRMHAGIQAASLTSKGTSGLGTHFRLGGFDNNSGTKATRAHVFSFMAIEDGTEINVTFPRGNIDILNVGVINQGTPLTISLNKGETYLGIIPTTTNPNNRDAILGALVESNNQIAVNTGSLTGSAYGSGAQDYGIDQIVGIDKMGYKFVYVKGNGIIPELETVYIVANEDNTNVFINGSDIPFATLNAGEYCMIDGDNFSVDFTLFVRTSKPVFTYQCTAGNNSGATIGLNFPPPWECIAKPEEIVISSINSVANNNSFNGGVYIIAQDTTTVTLTSNGVPVDISGSIMPVPGTDGVIAYRVMNLSGNIVVNSSSVCQVGYFAYAGIAAVAGYYAGFSHDVFKLDFVSQPEVCVPNSGQITLLINGGSAPYSYSWEDASTDSIRSNLTEGEYKIYAQDAMGCEDSIIAEVISLPNPEIFNDSITHPLCFGGNGYVSISDTTNGSLENYTIEWQPDIGADSITSTIKAGDYLIIVTDTNDCHDSVSISIQEPEELQLTLSDYNVCYGDTLDITAITSGGTLPLSYDWTNNESDSATYHIPINSDSIIHLTITDSNNCTVSDSSIITMKDTLSIIPLSDSTICKNTSLQIPAQYTSGTPPFTINWGDNSNDSIFESTITKYTVINLTITDGCNLSQNTVANIFVNDPKVEMLETSPPTCYSGSDGLITTEANVPGLTYSWSPNVSTDSTANNLEDGTYQILVTDSIGCNDSISVTIQEPEELKLTLSDYNICYGDSIGITAITSGGTLPLSYDWTNNESDSAVYYISLNSDSTIHLTVTDSNNCSTSDSSIITVNDTLSIIPLTDYTICINTIIEIPAIVFNGTPPIEFDWEGFSKDSIFEINLTQDTVIDLTITDGCNQVKTSKSKIYVNNPQINILETTNPKCFGGADGQIILEANTNSLTYTWTPNVSSDSIANYLRDGTYRVLATDTLGCTDSVTASIIHPPLLTISVDSAEICYRDTALLTANASGGTGTYEYIWQHGGSERKMYVAPRTTNNYAVKVRDENGCETNFTPSVVTVRDSLEFQITANDTICIGDIASIGIYDIRGGSKPYFVKWSDNLGEATGQQVAPESSTSYTCTVTDACPDEVTKSVNIHVNNLPEVDFVGDEGCAPLNARLQATTNAAEYNWNIEGEELTVVSSYIYYDFKAPGLYDISLHVIDSNSCENEKTLEQIVHVYENPNAAFDYSPKNATFANPKIYFNDLSSSNEGEITTWNWKFHDLDSSTIQHPNYFFPDSGYYDIELQVTTDFGCKDTIQHTVFLDGIYSIYVPNAFSPDNDGANDFFPPQALGLEDDGYDLKIFNRWGEMIYHSTDINQPWNGEKHNDGYKAQMDTYIYKIKGLSKFGDKVNLVGKIALIR